MPLSTCTKCKALVPLGQSRCLKHRPPSRKPSSTARGYGYEHQQLRAQYQRDMDRGVVFTCPRCHLPITGAWDLGHRDKGAGTYQGPEHPRCNRRAGATRTP